MSTIATMLEARQDDSIGDHDPVKTTGLAPEQLGGDLLDKHSDPFHRKVDIYNQQDEVVGTVTAVLATASQYDLISETAAKRWDSQCPRIPKRSRCRPEVFYQPVLDLLA